MNQSNEAFCDYLANTGLWRSTFLNNPVGANKQRLAEVIVVINVELMF
jgi:hypothetical protein